VAASSAQTAFVLVVRYMVPPVTMGYDSQVVWPKPSSRVQATPSRATLAALTWRSGLYLVLSGVPPNDGQPASLTAAGGAAAPGPGPGGPGPHAVTSRSAAPRPARRP
jgi:hypothetical protein